jgi:hypothetical protein
LRQGAAPDALTFVDVTVSQYWATEAYSCLQPRTYFNPTDNQAMGWSVWGMTQLGQGRHEDESVVGPEGWVGADGRQPHGGPHGVGGARRRC